MWYHKDDKLGFNTINLCLTIKIEKIMEIWTIRKDWSTLKMHASIEDADKFTHPEAFQTLYRKNGNSPIFLYKSF